MERVLICSLGSVRGNTSGIRITRTGEEFPRVRDFLRVFLFRLNLDYIRRRQGGRESSGTEEPSIYAVAVPVYLHTLHEVSRVHKRAIHICAETGFHRLASAHIGITLSLT